MLIALLVALFVIGADQATKMLVVQAMANEPDHDIPVINGILHLHYAQNTGAAFSMLEGMQWVFIVACVAATLAIVIFLSVKKMRIHWFGLLSLGFIMGGALGNLIDRIHTVDHSVIDFIYVKAINFAVFNVADSGITVGAVLLCIYILFFHEKYKKKFQANEPVKIGEPDGGEAQG